MSDNILPFTGVVGDDFVVSVEAVMLGAMEFVEESKPREVLVLVTGEDGALAIFSSHGSLESLRTVSVAQHRIVAALDTTDEEV